MPPCRTYCDLRDLLLAKENKINKLKQTINDLDDLCYHQPFCHHEVETKMAIINTMIQTTTNEAYQLIQQIANGCEVCQPHEQNRKRCTKTESSRKLLQRNSYPAHHPSAAPNGDGYKDREQMCVPDVHHHQSVNLSSQTHL